MTDQAIGDLELSIFYPITPEFDCDWLSMAALFEKFKDKFGHGNVVGLRGIKLKKEWCSLISWCRLQLSEYSSFQKGNFSKLTIWHIKHLHDIGFNLTPKTPGCSLIWEIMFHRLLNYKKVHGHIDIARRHSTLGAWLSYQRKSKFSLCV